MTRAKLDRGDHVLLSDLDGPDHLIRVAQVMLDTCPGARRTDETPVTPDRAGRDFIAETTGQLAVGIDARDGEVWAMPAGSEGLTGRWLDPADVLYGRLVRTPEPGDTVYVGRVERDETVETIGLARVVERVVQDCSTTMPNQYEVWLDLNRHPFVWTGRDFRRALLTGDVILMNDYGSTDHE